MIPALSLTYGEVVDRLEALVGELKQKAWFAHTCKQHKTENKSATF